MTAFTDGSNWVRARLITAAAVLMFALAGAAGLLPLSDRLPGPNVVGSLLLAGGVAEVLAGVQRRQSRATCVAAGSVTAIAGLLLVLNPVTHFFPISYLIVAWLFVRGLILAIASTHAGGQVRLWTVIAAATDAALGLVLLAGISIATLIVGLFGPTPEVIASFSWVLAFSFVVTGVWFLVTANCERAEAKRAD